MRYPTHQDLKTLIETTRVIRDRLANMDVGKASTRVVGGAVILTASFLVVANPQAPQSSDSSQVVSARIAPIGTVQLASTPTP